MVISEDGQALLLDFGFSSLICSPFTLTVPAPGADSLRWLAPEMLDNGEGSAEADMWAFGMTALVCFYSLAFVQLNRICAGIVHSEGTFP